MDRTCEQPQGFRENRNKKETYIRKKHLIRKEGFENLIHAGQIDGNRELGNHCRNDMMSLNKKDFGVTKIKQLIKSFNGEDAIESYDHLHSEGTRREKKNNMYIYITVNNLCKIIPFIVPLFIYFLQITLL